MTLLRPSFLLVLALSTLPLALPAQDSDGLSPEWIARMRATYEDPRDSNSAPVREWLAGLRSQDSETRADAVRLAIAMLRQARLDDETEPAGWDPELPWTLYPKQMIQTPASAFREQLLSTVVSMECGETVIPILRSAIRHETRPCFAEALRSVFDEGRGPAWDELAIEAATEAPDTLARYMALLHARRHRVRIGADALHDLAQHPVDAIRKLARACATQLSLPAPPPFDPERCMRSKTVIAMFGRIDRYIPSLPPADAPYAVVTLDFRQPDDDDEDWDEYERVIRGWLVATTDAHWTVVAPTGERVVVERNGTVYRATLRLQSIADEIAWIEANRDAPRGETPTVRFRESPLYELMFATWLRRQGRDRDAARVFLSPLREDRHSGADPACFVRDELGPRWVTRMLHAFITRDADRARRRANEILRCFPGPIYGPIARRVLRELDRARDAGDFERHVLPTPEEWKALAPTMPRADRIRYLVTRFRLLTHSEWAYRIGAGGGAFPDAPQFADVDGVGVSRPGDRHAPIRWRGPRRINPYEELVGRKDEESRERTGGMRLGVADIPTLTPLLADDRLMRWMRIWTGSSAVDLIPTRYAVTELINEAAGVYVLDCDWTELIAPATRAANIAWVEAWVRRCLATPGRNRIVVLLEHAAHTRRAYDGTLMCAIEDLVDRPAPGAGAAVAHYYDRCVMHRADQESLLRALVTLAPERAVARARRLGADVEADFAFLTAVGRLERSGSAASLAAVERGLRRLAVENSNHVGAGDLSRAVAVLLAKRTDAANRVARIVLEGGWLYRWFSDARTSVLRQFVKAGLPDAHDYCARWLESGPAISRRRLARDFVEHVVPRVPDDIYTDKRIQLSALVAWCRAESKRLRSAH